MATHSITLNIQGMTCAGCAGRVERALVAEKGVTKVAVNLATDTARVDFEDGATSVSAIAAASTEAGYAAEPAGSSSDRDLEDRRADELAHLTRNTWLSAILALPIFAIEMGGHMIPVLHHFIAGTIGQQASWVIQFCLASAVLAGPGRMFYAKGYPALLKGAPDMNSLVALGTSAAFLYSSVATFLPNLLPGAARAVYFEAAVVIVVLILVGRLLEARAKAKTGAAIRALAKLQPREAKVIREGREVSIGIDDLKAGDVIQIRPGERLPTDGVVTQGQSHVDESMISGEPLPVEVAEGTAVTGGTINGTGSFQFRATRVGAETTLAQIIRMVEDAQGAKLPIQSLADKIVRWFVPVILGIAALTTIMWLVFGPEPRISYALVAAVSVLIIACPCAMGLATPTSIMVGTGRAAEMGVLFRNGAALQSLSDVDIVAFDKTGTITAGRPEFSDIAVEPGFDRSDLLRVIAALEAKSEHPIAHAICRAAQGQELPEVSRFQSVTGFGLLATINGKDVAIGAERLMHDQGVVLPAGVTDCAADLSESGRTVLFAAVGGRLAAMISVSDPIKPDSKSAIAALKALGFEVALISGDRTATAQAVGRDVGIDHVIGDVLPGGKVDALLQLANGGRKVAFVGDGINDAPALAHADVGIAIGTGTDVALESADLALMSGDISGVRTAIEVSRQTMRNIRQNLFWAFGYNVALIPIAAGVLYPAFGLLLSPVLAAGAMSLSSVFVVTNALRLRTMKGST